MLWRRVLIIKWSEKFFLSKFIFAIFKMKFLILIFLTMNVFSEKKGFTLTQVFQLWSKTMSGIPFKSLCCYQGSRKKIVGFVEKNQMGNLSVHQTNHPVHWWLFLGSRNPNLLYWLNSQVFTRKYRVYGAKNLISKKKL